VRRRDDPTPRPTSHPLPHYPHLFLVISPHSIPSPMPREPRWGVRWWGVNVPSHSSVSCPFVLSLHPLPSLRPEGSVREWMTGEGETDGTTEPGMSEWTEMEEEIIGNRWKELDYDGYYLENEPRTRRSYHFSLHSLRPSRRVTSLSLRPDGA
jgi:hypothetical protein